MTERTGRSDFSRYSPAYAMGAKRIGIGAECPTPRANMAAGWAPRRQWMDCGGSMDGGALVNPWKRVVQWIAQRLPMVIV